MTDSLSAVLDGKPVAVESVRTSGKADGSPRVLVDPAANRRLTLRADGNDAWLAWNPGRARTPLCRTLGPNEWKEFFCVEPYVESPYRLAPGESKTLMLEVEAESMRRVRQ